MASRFVREPQPQGSFLVISGEDDEVTITYTLSEERAAAAEAQGSGLAPHQCNVPLLGVIPSEDRVATFPVNTVPGDRNFLKSKYDRLVSIDLVGFDFFSLNPPEWSQDGEVEELLNALPAGFVRDPEYGLGLLKELDLIVRAVEAVPGVTRLEIHKKGVSKVEGDTYFLTYPDFESLRKGMGRIHRNAVSSAHMDKYVLVHNTLLHGKMPEQFKEARRPYKPDTVFKAITMTNLKPDVVSAADGATAAKVVIAAKRRMAREDNGSLLDLQREIELVTLETLIEKLRVKLDKSLSEDVWQAFFLDNPFVLTLAFSLPIVAVAEQVSVGGRRFSGQGEKVADFLHRNDLTDNLTLVEIKAAKARLLGSEYRTGVFGASSELAGAITQVLDQRFQLQKSIAAKKEASRRWDLESYAVKCLLIAGRTPEEPDELKSLELFRNSLGDVSLVTYDELLLKLEHLHRFLVGTNRPTSRVLGAGDL